MSRTGFIRATLTAALFGYATTAHAQGTFAGAWTIAEWSVAPWVPDAERARIKPNDNVLNHSLIFTAKHVVGPELLSCDTPKYQTISSPIEGLFEGGLLKPKTDGVALGFKAPVKTLRPACDFDFHLKDANTAMFALDNVLYTMKRKNPTPG
ncbi:MAG: hypothetical protein ABI852_15225 [Gemmatimonadaceae bacterium]